MKILILGASSLLTKYLIPLHIAKKDRIDVLYFNEPDKRYDNVSYTSISSIDTLHNDYDVVYLIAAHIPKGSGSDENQSLFEANIQLVVTTCERFQSARLIFCSSVSVYGSNTIGVTEEDRFIHPSLYGLSKIAGEAIIKLHPSYSIIRFSSLYAAEMKANTFLPLIVDAAIKKREITLLNDPNRRQNYLHFSDAANMIFLASGLKENVVLLGVYEHEYTNIEIARNISELIGGSEEVKISFQNKNVPAHSFSYKADLSRKILNYRNKVSIEEGLKEIIQWKRKLS